MAAMANTMTAEQRMAVEHSVAEGRERESVAKNLALFFAAPFIGLAYIVAFPFMGCAILVKAALRG